MSKVNQCKNCKNMEGDSKCNRLNPKTGLPLTTAFSCDLERSANWFQSRFFNLCGKSGRFFEPKKS